MLVSSATRSFLKLNPPFVLYGELRRRHASDSWPGFPSSSLGGGASTVVSDRVGEIATEQADKGDRDCVHQALIQLEATLDECEHKIRSAVSRVLALPAIHPPKPRTRDVCDLWRSHVDRWSAGKRQKCAGNACGLAE